ncbi:type I-E CRISPR-associated protein Cse1/CasA [Chloracidobacterium validum]|uniref:Type I-E CRISPR-associated protein Cse1/CasA n=1 Tax=Chloracidobacterium validum TaxID=2821543 RepID=A0ABX8BAT4_9BACT|nr:type I-E CRISPR-associated protein Cse1/CasA [Chloracidobacterium validum]QUW04042.1 type I-E CRISPR-associated protein Cse1/CasA [Chloracidobacterium validum]
MPSFNLVIQPWIPCSLLNGTQVELSLREVFQRAHELRAIEDESPLVNAALYRLLLAIVHRAIDGPQSERDWHTGWQHRNFHQTPMDNYLTTWQDRFDLFSETEPFFQTAGFEVKEPTPLSRLFIQHLRMFFNHPAEDGERWFTPAEAARGLLAAQAFALAGGKGVTSNLFGEHPYLSGAPLAPGVVTLLRGDTVFETLLLNLLIYRDNHPIPRLGDDLPIWERGSANNRKKFWPHKESLVPDGYLDYLTWMSRHIRLIPVEQGNRVFVRDMYFGQACTVADIVTEPMFAYVRRKEKDGMRFVPVQLSPDRALWRDSAALFGFVEGGQETSSKRPQAFDFAANLARKAFIPTEKKFECMLFGLAYDQGNPLVWRQETMPVPRSLLTKIEAVRELRDAVELTESVEQNLIRASRKVAEVCLTDGTRKADGKAVTQFVTALGVAPLYWSRLDIPFRRFLQALQDLPEDPPDADLDALAKGWRKEVFAICEATFSASMDNCLGRTARELKGRAEGEAMLKRLRKTMTETTR